MPVTALDPTSALVLIDLQKGVLRGAPLAHPAEEVLAHAAALADAFRARGLPVVLVTVAGASGVRTDRSATTAPPAELPADFAELVPELHAQGTDIRIVKRTVGAFARTDLEARLRELGVTQIVVAGVSTSAGVESTVRAGADLGFHVTVATDACTDRSAAAHETAVSATLGRFAETGTTAEVLALLEPAAR